MTYPAEVGAGLEAGSLGYLPREAAKICHRSLPLVRERVYGGPLRRVFRALTGPRQLQAPVLVEFLTDPVLVEQLVAEGRSREKAEELARDFYCAAFSEMPGNVVRCRTEVWTQRSNQRDFKLVFPHELVHLALRHPRGTLPGWLNEGLANHLAYRLGFAGADHPSCAGGRRHYTHGYDCAGALLGFTRRYYGLDLEGMSADLAAGEGKTPAGLDKVFDRAAAKRRAGVALTVEGLWHRCLLVEEAKGGCKGGTPHVDARGHRKDEPGCTLCKTSAKAARSP